MTVQVSLIVQLHLAPTEHDLRDFIRKLWESGTEYRNSTQVLEASCSQKAWKTFTCSTLRLDT